jgi:hypothetical protein
LSGRGTNVTPRFAQDFVGCRCGAFDIASAVGFRAQVLLDFSRPLPKAVNRLLELRDSLSASLVVFEEAGIASAPSETSSGTTLSSSTVPSSIATASCLLLVHRRLRGGATSTVEIGGDERRHLALGRDPQLVGAEVVQLSDSRRRLER